MTLDDSTATGDASPLLRAFAWVALAEAFTWAGLLVGMFVKYIVHTTELGVKVFGPLHGIAFVAYVVITVLVAQVQRWPWRWTTIVALAAAIPPLATVVFHRWALRRGLLNEPAAERNAPKPHAEATGAAGNR